MEVYSRRMIRNHKMDTRRRNTIRRFMEGTTIKGVAHASKAKNTFSRVLWIVALIFGIAVGSFFIFRLAVLYGSHSISTGIIEKQGLPPFPSVTLCNLNPLALYPDIGPDMESFLELLREKDRIHNSTIANYKWKTPGFALDLTKLEDYYGFFQNRNTNFTADYKFFIMDCMWSSKNMNFGYQSCASSFNQRFLNAEFGSCFTLDSPVHTTDGGKTDIFSLDIILYINDFLQFRVPSFNIFYPIASGVRLNLHEQGVLPNMEKGINLEPGHHLKIQVEPVFRTRLPEPYTTCSLEKYLNATSASYQGFTYSQDACQAVCYQMNMINKCNCMEPMYYAPNELKSKYRFCLDITQNFTDFLEHVDCLMITSMAGPQHCHCPIRCEEYYYTMRSFSSPWPSPMNQIAFYETHIKHKRFASKFGIYENISNVMKKDKDKAFQMLQETNLIRNNFLQVKLSFLEEVLSVVEDKPVLTLEGFIGGVGGIFNLWVGLSFITLVEVIDMVAQLLVSFNEKTPNHVNREEELKLRDVAGNPNNVS